PPAGRSGGRDPAGLRGGPETRRHPCPAARHRGHPSDFRRGTGAGLRPDATDYNRPHGRHLPPAPGRCPAAGQPAARRHPCARRHRRAHDRQCPSRSRYRLARLAPVRLRPRTGGLDHPPALLALRGRPQPPAGRHHAVSGPEHHRPVPGDPVQRRTRVPARRRAGCGRDRAQGGNVLAPVPRQPRRRAAAHPRPAWPGGAVGRPLDPRHPAVPVRGRTAGPQPRHRRRPQLFARPAAAPGRSAGRAPAIHPRGQRPLQGRLHHPPLRRAGYRRRSRAARAGPAHLHGRGQLRLRPCARRGAATGAARAAAGGAGMSGRGPALAAAAGEGAEEPAPARPAAATAGGDDARKARARQRWGRLYAALGAVLFSGKAIIVKLGYRHGADAVTLLALRMLVAFPFFLLMGAWATRSARTTLHRGHYLRILVLGALGYYLASFLDFAGLAYITATLERLILYLTPTLVLLIGWLAFGRRPGRLQWIALAVSYAGVALAFGHDLVAGGEGIVLGGVLV